MFRKDWTVVWNDIIGHSSQLKLLPRQSWNERIYSPVKNLQVEATKAVIRVRRYPKILNIRREGKREEEGRNENGKKEFARLLSQNGGEAEAYALGSSSLTIEYWLFSHSNFPRTAILNFYDVIWLPLWLGNKDLLYSPISKKVASVMVVS